MAETSPTPSRLKPEQRRAALQQFERAKQVLKGGDYDYALQLLLACCKIDPVNLIYRQELRRTQRAKYEDRGRGQPLAPLLSLWTRMRLMWAMRSENYNEALVQAELILMRNPWDLAAHLRMAETFEEMEWPDHALWTLEQIRPTHPQNPKVNRPLARLYERRGNFNLAITLWEQVRKAVPSDLEAQRKAKDLAASATIAKGRYEEAVKGEAPSPLVQNEEELEEAEAVDTAVDRESSEASPNAAPKTSSATGAERRTPKEVATAQQRIKSDPKNPLGYIQLAELYRKAEQLDQAKAVLQGALGPTGNNFEVQQLLLELEIDPFRRDLAITEEQLRKKPGDADLQQIRNQLTREINARELDYYRRRAERNPADMPAKFEMGLRLLRAGQSEEAIKELQAVRNEPRFHARALFYLGICFKSRNNWRLAQRNLEEALQHLGAEKDAFLRKEAMYILAVGYADAGELQQAIDLGCDLANLDYNYKDISQLVERWQTKVEK
jgi:tetratricopeptide (TPR) repeat protein